MHAQDPRLIVVAVGYDDVESALRFGVKQARRGGAAVHLVHVVQLRPTGPEVVLLTEVDVEKIGRETLDLAADKARDLAGDDVEVTQSLRIGAIVPSLVAAARDARMVVLEHRELSRLARVVTRSVAGGVAARAQVPVVSVPSGWVPEGAGSVVVGVDEPRRSHAVLRTALREARSRGTALRVVHAWSVPAPYEGVLLGVAEEERWTERASGEVREALDALAEEAAGVQVDIDVRYGRPAESLLAAAGDAGLLVVGRHDPLIPIGSHLGSVARAVLREAACPVLVSDPRDRQHD